MINFGTHPISAIYYGTREISAVYKGSTLVWQKQQEDPRGPLGWYVLSGTGAYAKYNGYWGRAWKDGVYSVVLQKEDTTLTGSIISTYIYADRHFPNKESVITPNFSAYAKQTALQADPYFYSFNSFSTSEDIPESGLTFTNEDFNDPTYGSFTCASASFYNGDGYNVTSGGTPGVLISSHLWEVPFDEKYKTITVLDSIDGEVSHLSMLDDVLFYAGNMTWTNAASSIFFKPGGWQNGGWVEDKKIGWGLIHPDGSSTMVLAAISGSYAWPWCAGNNTWRFFSFTSTPNYGKVCCVPLGDSFVGVEASGAGVAAMNGVYVPSGTYNGIRCFQKRDGESVLAYYDGAWEFYADRSQLGGLGYYYDDTSILGTYGHRSIDYAPGPIVSVYLEEYEQGGGGEVGTGTVVFTCGGGSGSVTLNGVTKNTNGGGQQLTFEDLPEGTYPVTYGNMGSGPASVTVMAGETTSVTCNFPCFAAGTKITLADGTEKNVEEITYEDELLTWSFDEACYSKAKPAWILKEQEEAPTYMLSVYDDGTELKTVGPDGMHHELYDVDAHTFKYTDEMVGRHVFTTNGVKTCLACRIVKEPARFYNIITAHDFNCFANGILTSCRLNKLYDIDEHMQFIKKERHFEHPTLSGIDARLKEGLRLEELNSSYESYLAHLEKEKKN